MQYTTASQQLTRFSVQNPHVNTRKKGNRPLKKNSTLLQVKAFCLTSGFLLLFAEPEEGINVLPQLEIEFKKKKKEFMSKKMIFFFLLFFFKITH